MEKEPKEFLLNCFNAVIRAGSPQKILKSYLPGDRSAPVVVIGAGKAAASMARAFEDNWTGPIKGLVICPYGHSLPCQRIEVVEAAHPIADKMSAKMAKRILKLCKNLSKHTVVYFLISGGGSSLLSLAGEGITHQDKQAVIKALLNSGATINEINCVRKHLSAIKGGRLAQYCQPAKIITFAISDVMSDIMGDDDPSVIASGPTVGDNTLSKDALNILRQYNIDISDKISQWLNNPLSETLNQNDPLFKNTQYEIIIRASDGLRAAEKFARKNNINCINLGEIGGDARGLGINHGHLALAQDVKKPTLIISGGETTVNIKGDGKGGRNSEYLLSLALTLKGSENIYALAADTDGIDGSEDNAGAYMSPLTLKRAKDQRINLIALLENNDSYSAFKALDDLIMTGPTRTNINDFRAILILPNP